MIQVLTKSAFRQERLLTLGGYPNPDELFSMKLWDRGGVVTSGAGDTPEEAVRNLFDSCLASSVFKVTDFDGYKRISVYRARSTNTALTVKSLRLLVSTQYERIPFPEDCEDWNHDDPNQYSFEFLLSYRGSRNSAERVLLDLKNSVRLENA
jgi:hypothetical protein